MDAHMTKTTKTKPATLDEAEVLRAIQGAPHEWVDVGHSELASWTFGTGPELVFVHGWPLHSATFRRLVPVLAQHYTCRLFDLPGVGQTRTGPEARIGLKEHADTLQRFVDRLGLRRFGLIGHDSGAAIARFAAASMGDRVSALVMGNTEIPGHHAWQLKAYLLALKIPGGLKMFSASLGWRWMRRSPLGFGGCFTDAAYADGAFGHLFVRPLRTDAAVLAGQVRLLEGFDWGVVDELEDAHARIHAPTCLIWGAADPFFPLPKAKAMLEQFAGPSELRAIEGAKLFAHEDHADVFAAHAVDFLQARVGAMDAVLA